MTARKVAIFTHGIQRGPFAVLSTTLARGFESVGVHCDVVVLNATCEERARYPDVNVVALNAPRAALALMPLIRYIKKHQPGTIFSMPWYFNVITIWAKQLSWANTKVIIGEHNICSLESSIEHGDKFPTRYLPLLMRFSYPFSDGLIGVCKDTITDLVEVCKISAKIPKTIIPNPIDSQRIRNLAEEPIDHSWFQNDNLPVILTVARLARQKNLDILLRAFAQVSKTVSARLLILGDGPLRSQLEQLCRELGIEKDVSLPGYIQNPYRFMSACDVFVLASAWEACPIALEEALACGAATIVNDAPGAAREIVDHGKYGMVVPANNPEALAEAIVQVLSDRNLKKYYQEQACQRSQAFEYQNISQQYLDFANAV